MSASGHVPFFPAYSAQSRVKSNCFRSSFQSSQKSSEIRHICAYFSKNSASERGAGPGEMLSTIGRPVFRIARLNAFISAGWYKWLPMSSALMKSTPQDAYSSAIES